MNILLAFSDFFLNRVHAYIDNGWADNVVDPDSATPETIPTAMLPISDCWQDIRKAYTPSTVPRFTNSQIVGYFVTRTALDGLQCGDFKSVNESAMNLFRCGHVQQIEVGTTSDELLLQAKCLPEMKKDRVYKLSISMKKDSLDILTAECGCPGGKGPNATCKHIGALCYAFSNFCEQGTLPDFLSCTQQLQEWNKPRPKKLDPVPVANLLSHQLTIKQPSKLQRHPRTSTNYDPRPPHLRCTNRLEIDKLRADLLSLGQPCALLTILVPDVNLALHDHTYTKEPVDKETIQTQMHSHLTYPCPYSPEELIKKCVHILNQLLVTSEERKEIERLTRHQSDSPFWFEVRSKRITSSKCGQILKQKSRTPALLKNILYPKPLFPDPAPIRWGRVNESVACQKYTEFMQLNGHPHIVVEAECGFIVHLEEGWLGASPDGVVSDPVRNPSFGLLEIKCPYSVREISPAEACQDPSFYCYISDDGSIKLKRNHSYYHQVQLQIYVCSDICNWCDFCVYTTKGIAVEHITVDREWIQKCIPELRVQFSSS